MSAQDHIAALRAAIRTLEEGGLGTVERLGRTLGKRLAHGSRVLVCGNGESAALAQIITAALLARDPTGRQPMSAIGLSSDASALTAIVDQYGPIEGFARQVKAHGRPGDVLLVLSTSGHRANLIAAVHMAAECGLASWALTGPAPNPLSRLCDEFIGVQAATSATINEVHQVILHLLCAAVDREARPRTPVLKVVATPETQLPSPQRRGSGLRVSRAPLPGKQNSDGTTPAHTSPRETGLRPGDLGTREPSA